MKNRHLPARADAVVLAAIALVVGLVLVWYRAHPIDYTSLDTTGVSYVRGTVTEVVDEDVQATSYDAGRCWGSQVLLVRLLDGSLAGEEVEITNTLSDTHQIQCVEGTSVIVRVESDEGLDPYFSIYNYDRGLGLAGLIAAFVVLMVLVGGIKGLKSLVGVAFAVFLVVCFALPAFYHGYPVIPVTLAVVFAITVSSMVLLNGASDKTGVAIAATMCGVLVAAVCYALFSHVLQVSGYNLDEAEELIFIRQRSGLSIGTLLFTCVLIASLGAVLDMTMSVVTALFEMKSVHPAATGRELFRSGIGMGQDMVGTMSQTLILAFAGSAIPSLLSLFTYGTQALQLLNSDYLTVEIVQSLIGSLAVILAVPLSSLFSALVLRRRDAAKSR